MKIHGLNADLHLFGTSSAFSGTDMSQVGSRSNIYEINDYAKSFWDPRSPISVSNAPAVKREIYQTGRIEFESAPSGTPSVAGNFFPFHQILRTNNATLNLTLNLEQQSHFQDKGGRRYDMRPDAQLEFERIDDASSPIDEVEGTPSEYNPAELLQKAEDADKYVGVRLFQDYGKQNQSDPTDPSEDREISFYGKFSNISIEIAQGSMIRGTFSIVEDLLPIDSQNVNQTLRAFEPRIHQDFI